MLLYFINDSEIALFIYITTILIFANVYVVSKCNEVKEMIDIDNVLMKKMSKMTKDYGSDEVVRACGDDVDLMIAIVTLPMLAIDRFVKYSKLLIIRKVMFIGTITFIVTNFVLWLIL